MIIGWESKQNSGAMRGEIARLCLQMIGCLKIESVAAPPRHCEERKRRSNPFFLCGAVDCFRLRSSSYGGHVASLAMTGRVGGQRRPSRRAHHASANQDGGHACALPTLVLARSIILASFREEWPSPGGRPGWAADRSDRCPPKPRGLSSVARSRSALHRDPDG